MSDFQFIAFVLFHCGSYEFVAWKINAGIAEVNSPDRVNAFFITPRSLANLWRPLISLTFLRTRDASFIVAGIIHIATTITFFIWWIKMAFI